MLNLGVSIWLIRAERVRYPDSYGPHRTGGRPPLPRAPPGATVPRGTRTATDLSARRIAEIIAKLPTWATYLDGQTTVLGDDGVTSFAALQDALSRHQAER